MRKNVRMPMVRIEEGMLLQVTALRESSFDWLKNVGKLKKMKVVQRHLESVIKVVVQNEEGYC